MTPYNKLIERRNAGDKISNDDVRDALISTIRGIDNLKDLNDFLCTFHASDAYTVIVEYVKPKNNELIQNASKTILMSTSGSRISRYRQGMYINMKKELQQCSMLIIYQIRWL